VVIGFFTVIAVLSSVLATRDGIALSTARPGSEAIAVVKASHGTPDAHTLDLIGQTPGVKRDANGPMAGGVAVGVNWIRDWRPDTLGIMAVYGIERGKIALLPNFRLLKGRMFRPGLNELMIGKGAVRLYPAFGLGKTMKWHHSAWKIVGVFETGSDVQDSMLLGDLHQIQAAIAKGNGYDFISARLTSPAAFDAFKKSLESRPGSSVYVKRLSEQDSDLGKPFQIILSLAAAVITLLMSVGAIFASLNVMYANVSRGAYVLEDVAKPQVAGAAVAQTAPPPPVVDKAPAPAAVAAKPAETLQSAMAKQRAAIAVQRQAVRLQRDSVVPWMLESPRVEAAAAPDAASEDCDPMADPELTPLIDTAAQLHQVEPKLLRGVIEQESGFHACAISAKGARGLMQLMPATVEQFKVGDAFDPKQNIEAGANGHLTLRRRIRSCKKQKRQQYGRKGNFVHVETPSMVCMW